MKRYLRNIAVSILIILYMTSTSGFVIKYGICFCTNRISVDFYKTGQSGCPFCHHNTRKTDCCKHSPVIIPIEDCCKSDLKYIKYNPETNLTESLNPKIFLNSIFFSNRVNIQAETPGLQNIIKRIACSPPPEKNFRTIIFLHQLVFSPEEAA